MKMYFRCVVYLKSQSKSLNQVSKSKCYLQIHCLLHPIESTRFFFETHKNKLHQMVEDSIKMIHYLTVLRNMFTLFFV